MKSPPWPVSSGSYLSATTSPFAKVTGASAIAFSRHVMTVGVITLIGFAARLFERGSELNGAFVCCDRHRWLRSGP